MKHRLIFFIVLSLLALSCDKDNNNGLVLSEFDMNRPVGFGAGVTGGDGRNVVLVTTAQDLAAAVSGTRAATVYVKGSISLDGTIPVGSNKSIIGLPGATISNLHRDENAGIFFLLGSENVIIRNLTLKGPGAYDIDANNADNISVVGSSRIWVDHCDIQDGIDGNFDITDGSDMVCVSWTRFRYLIDPLSSGTGGNDNHRNSNLIGNSNKTADIDAGRLNCTFINCWWGEGCSERCPRVRFGKVHVVNCLYDGNDFTYCIGYGVYSNIYVEKCAFTTASAQQNALQDWHGTADFNITVTACQGVPDTVLSEGAQQQFVPQYEYVSYDASRVAAVLTHPTTGAGPTLETTMR